MSVYDDILADPGNAQAIKLAAYGVVETPASNLVAGNRMVSVVEGPVVEHGCVKVTLALWIDFGQGWEYTPLDNPFYFKNPPILVPDPNGPIERTWTDPWGVVHSAFFREDLDAALMQMAYDATANVAGSGGEV